MCGNLYNVIAHIYICSEAIYPFACEYMDIFKGSPVLQILEPEKQLKLEQQQQLKVKLREEQQQSSMSGESYMESDFYNDSAYTQDIRWGAG